MQEVRARRAHLLKKIDRISQWVIFFLGTVSTVLLTSKNKWGNVFGLAAQPFWFYTTYYNKQWPVFCVSIICTIAWINGIYQWFF